MTTLHTPLVLPLPLVNLPQDYQSKIPLYDSSSSTTAHLHVDRMNDYFNRNEIDDDTVKLRLFAQSLGGESRKWFKGLTPHSINDLQAFHQFFKKNGRSRRTLFRFYQNMRISKGMQEGEFKSIAPNLIVCTMPYPFK